MRLWLVDPRIMCRQHLLGEHLESHMFVGSILRGRSVQGYVDRNLLEVRSLVPRHGSLVTEMESRGYRHRSPMTASTDLLLEKVPAPLRTRTIDRTRSLSELLSRCSRCRIRSIALETRSP